MQARVLSKKNRTLEDAVPWIGSAIALVASVLLDSPSQPHKWHPAIMWTICAFVCVVLFGRSRWRLTRFWMFCAAFFVLHLFTMWVLFDKILPSNRGLGTLYVAPIAFVEGIRNMDPWHHWETAGAEFQS